MEIIYLNIGGSQFTTTKQTLMKFPTSKLAKIWENAVKADKNGHYFFDRSGRVFEYILNYIRFEELILPDDFSEINLLKNEADYYEIKPLSEEIQKYKEKQEKAKLNDGKQRSLLVCRFLGVPEEPYIFVKSRFTEYKPANLEVEYKVSEYSWLSYLESHWVLRKELVLDGDTAMAYLMSQGVDTSFRKESCEGASIGIWEEKMFSD